MSETAVMTLTDFLLARIAEVENVARSVPEVGPKSSAPYFTSLHEPTGTVEVSPARVLAECEAKRRIVEEHGVNKYRVDPCDAHDANFETIPCDTLRYLAAVYADHPDYRDEWRPVRLPSGKVGPNR